MKPDYSNWLVASDIDGTLHSKLRTLPEINKRTIDRFMSCGGNFTLASGRPVRSLERAYRRVSPNCPAIILKFHSKTQEELLALICIDDGTSLEEN